MHVIIIPDILNLGPNTYEEARTYIKEKFLELNRSRNPNLPKKEIYTHYTCATDTTNIKFVFESITDSIITKHLQEMGML